MVGSTIAQRSGIKTFLLFKSFSFGKRDKNKTPKFSQIHRKWSRNYLRFYIKDDKFHSLGGNKDISFDLSSYLSVSEFHLPNDIFSNLQSCWNSSRRNYSKWSSGLMYPHVSLPLGSAARKLQRVENLIKNN